MYAISETSTIVLTITLTVLATFALGLRLMQVDRGDTFRYRWHVDDYLCTVAMVSGLPSIFYLHPQYGYQTKLNL